MMDGNRVGSSPIPVQVTGPIPVSGVDLRHHVQQLQREQTAWRAVQVSDSEVPPDIRHAHPPPMVHKDHQQQTILWSNAAGMSGPVSMPGMQPPNMPPPHMATNMPPLMQGPNMPLPPNMAPAPHPAQHISPPISMPNVSHAQNMQGMTLVHTSQAEQMHPYHRGEIPLDRNGGDPRMMGGSHSGVGGGGGVVGGDSGMREPEQHMEPPPPPPPKKEKAPKEKVKKVKKPPKEKANKDAASASTGDKETKPAVEKKPSKAKVCACERCGKGFVSWQNMKIHYTNVHKEDGIEKQYNTKCPYEGCGKSFFHRKTMLKHLEQDHGVKTEQEHYEFENMDAFLDWKELTEAENHVYFVKQRGLRFHKGWYDQHFYCQRDGSARAHVKKGQPERKTNRRAKKGVTKTGIACPAKMSMKYQKGERKVSVVYTKTHSHPISITDTQFHPIPKRTIAQLSEQFAKGVPVKQVHREIKHVVNQFLNPPNEPEVPEPAETAEQEKEKDEGENEVKTAEPPTTPEERKRKSPRRHSAPAPEPEFSPPITPALVRVLNKRQLHAIKVQADTARIRDACQKLVSVFERSARVRKKLLEQATQQVEDLLEECISVALAPSSTPQKRSKVRSKKSAKRRKLQLKDVIQEAAQQENIQCDLQEVEVEAENIHESLVEDVEDEPPGDPSSEPTNEESTSKDDNQDDVPHDQQTIEIPLTNLAESRTVHLQEALPEEESCVVTLLAQMEGNTVIDYYKDKDPNTQTVVTEVRTFDGDTVTVTEESNQNQSSYQVLMEQSSEVPTSEPQE